MAAGDTLIIFIPHSAEPADTNFATLMVRNDHAAVAFDAATDETAYFAGVMPRHYAAGGVDVNLVWLADTATTGNTKWNVAFERHQGDTTDLDTDSFAAAQTVTVGTNATAGAPNYDTVSFTDGAQMDSVAAGESFRLSIARDADDAGDTMVGDAQLIRVEIRESP